MAASSSKRVVDLRGDDGVREGASPEESLRAIVAGTYVVGKIIGDRRPHIGQIQTFSCTKGVIRKGASTVVPLYAAEGHSLSSCNQLMNVWYIKGDFRIIPKPNNIFLIGFELEEDKKKVLKGAPWLISNQLFCMKGWYPDMILSQVSFRLTMFWVQLHGIPPHLLVHSKIVK
ncbi:hypothetical protein Tsubulata_045326 [Turnera subulata]|uniref:DUF4283 domain-containing protein n=1 Tax=Turnera subulata TaxID=218843 RepID=A0A9Q0F4A5_9ROSI|nr:hypothetical protein Tsubulata_045326 [Turnera subulata]